MGGQEVWHSGLTLRAKSKKISGRSALRKYKGQSTSGVNLELPLQPEMKKDSNFDRLEDGGAWLTVGEQKLPQSVLACQMGGGGQGGEVATFQGVVGILSREERVPRPVSKKGMKYRAKGGRVSTFARGIPSEGGSSETSSLITRDQRPVRSVIILGVGSVTSQRPAGRHCEATASRRGTSLPS